MIGGELAATFLSRGWRVLAVVRDRNNGISPGERLQQRLMKSNRHWSRNRGSLIVLAGDVTKHNLGMPERYPGELSAIVHCAGETSFKNDDLCWETNCIGAERIVAFAARMAVPPTILFVSTAFVCLSPPHSVVSEDTCYGGYDNGYTRSKRQAEQVFLRSGLRVVIVRPSIVLSAGIQDRRMARSVLWAVPLLMRMAEIPIDGAARLDIVPVDYVAQAVERLLAKRSLSHTCYNVSSGQRGSVTCAEIAEDTFRRGYCEKRPTFLSSDKSRSYPRPHRLPTSSLDYYLPFLRADVVYSNDRLVKELGSSHPNCARATEYIHELLAQIEVTEALRESECP